MKRDGLKPGTGRLAPDFHAGHRQHPPIPEGTDLIEAAIIRGHRPTQISQLVLRDGAYCGCGCGAQLIRWAPRVEAMAKTNIEIDPFDSDLRPYLEHAYCGPSVPEFVGGFTILRMTLMVVLEVEHTVPLWKVATLPDERRIEYFKLGNLMLWTRDCHKRKTAREAPERAHYNRLERRRQPERPPLVDADGVRL